ncbi:IclR family transcriptional regulator [Rugosimonospora acidiphila]|uniref:IclR family transcriptional regulator n=1 Tax=Rugosimonospora acidiphila TaxID=556531 RepID=A0ABP9S3Y0_9ACTN
MRSSDRLLDLLEELSAANGATLTALSSKLQLPKPTVLRFLRSLEERAWVIRLPDGGYALGPHFLATAQKAIGDDAVLRCAAPHMLSLRDLLDETVSLLSVAGTSRVCTIEYRSSQPLRFVHEIGMRAPLHAGASGKVLLAFGPAALRKAVLAEPLERFTGHTFTDVAHLENELRKVRGAGWAMSRGERSEGGLAFAVPVRDPQSGRVHSLTIFAPEARYRAAERATWVRQLTACARAIETAAGVSRGDHCA